MQEGNTRDADFLYTVVFGSFFVKCIQAYIYILDFLTVLEEVHILSCLIGDKMKKTHIAKFTIFSLEIILPTCLIPLGQILVGGI